jgi:CxxC motif-containing protein (DUF1111 family)
MLFRAAAALIAWVAVAGVGEIGTGTVGMGKGLADRDLKGRPAPERWRTAPLWGMHAAYVTGRPVRLLHDGRAASLEEAILWHDGEGRRARDGFARLTQDERLRLVEWVEGLCGYHPGPR